MSWLLDTNVLSEIRKPARLRVAAVTSWYAAVQAEDIFLSVIVVGEIRKGIELRRRKDPVAADVLDKWLERLRAAHASRILPVDEDVAEDWGRLSALRPLSVPDGLLAATARVYDLTLVTRNVRDVAGLPVRVLNPFGSHDAG